MPSFLRNVLTYEWFGIVLLFVSRELKPRIGISAQRAGVSETCGAYLYCALLHRDTGSNHGCQISQRALRRLAAHGHITRCRRHASKDEQSNRKRTDNRCKATEPLIPVSYTHLRAHETEADL
eukprot:2200643-Amphidinium_carterae.2